MSSDEPSIFLPEDAIHACLEEMAQAIAERSAAPTGSLAVVGIERGGALLGARLAEALRSRTGVDVPFGTVDIGLHRDDAATALRDSHIAPSHIPFEVRGSHLILVDDVLQTGRTVRAAIDCLLDYGRPRRLWLACLLDRGGRELPIAPDYVGKVVSLASTLKAKLVKASDGSLRIESQPFRKAGA